MAKRKPPTTLMMAFGPCLDELRLADLASIDSVEKTWDLRQGRIGHNELSPLSSNLVVSKMRRFWGKAWTYLVVFLHLSFSLFDSVSTFSIYLCLYHLYLYLCDLYLRSLYLCDLSIYLSVCLSINLSTYQSINLWIYESMNLWIYESMNLWIYLSIYLICIYLNLHIYIYTYIYI